MEVQHSFCSSYGIESYFAKCDKGVILIHFCVQGYSCKYNLPPITLKTYVANWNNMTLIVANIIMSLVNTHG
jgi:hypothetical protein